jgi:hypothetical protein
VRCLHCGNENPETHRFCGMCGASLLQGPGAAMAAPGNTIPPPGGSTPTPKASATTATATAARPGSSQSAPTATAAHPATPAPAATAANLEPAQSATRAPQRAVESEPVISGPSFLGLNQPAPARKQASLSIDPNAAPTSRNLDYLLEEEDEPKGGGWKVVLILIALALAVSFGYLRWKNQGLPLLNLSPKRSAQSPAITEVPANPDASSNPSANPANPPTGSAAPATSSPSTARNFNPATAPVVNAPASSGGNQPASNGSAPAASGEETPGPSSSGADNTPANGAPAINPATPAGAAANPNGPPVQPAGNGPSDNAPATSAPQTQTSTAKNSDDSDSTDSEAADDNATAMAEATRKPPAAVKRTDPVAEAQKYLYGKGVSQDCDRGLRLLKPAANAGNPKAMIEMGALYSAGLCTPRDLPTSYRWFAMALHKDPDNQAVATDLQKLWGEMTQPERQLAIRLSQ